MLNSDVTYLSAFLVGLLGGVHCVAMCGGIVGALSFGVSGEKGRAPWPYLLAYNVARISSYTLAGTLMGGLSWLAGQWFEVHWWQQGLQLVAGLFMLALGLYIAGWWRGLAKVEQAGGGFWRRIEPLGRRLLPVRSVSQAFALGLLWGWLPCSLVYSVLIWAAASGSPLNGGALLLSFGLGTLPNLLAMGAFALALRTLVQRTWVRQLAGGLIIGFGLLILWRSL
ncbi:MAG TPA: sulfite exporter TauE/SafE family protein [Gammaproteobacteria bacterium]|nr:sulfite exporter TauE/SafE family protein [Gammaproteobacteria bacterium]